MLPSRIKLPDEFPLDKLEMGQSRYAAFTFVVVDAKDHAKYLQKNATIVPPNPLFSGIVKRDGNGYHIILHERRVRFLPTVITDYSDLIPVVTIREELDPNNPFNK